jgi:hypothetical protein
VKTQVWTAIPVYVLAAIIKKRPNSFTIFDPGSIDLASADQLSLFDL